jgi:cytochrome c556
MHKVIILFGLGAGVICAQQEDAQYSQWMKTTQQSINSIKNAINAKDDATVKSEADKLAGIFEEVAGFWKQHDKEDAVKLADTTRDAAKAVAAANGAEAQNAALQQVQQTCRPCHTVYRVGNKIKM